MTTRTNRETSVWTRKTNVLAAGLLLVAAMMAAGMMDAQPAHASTTFTVNSQQGDGSDATIADSVKGLFG
jgi:hypothetical protein